MQANKFNVADSEQYKKNEELRKHQSDVQYKVRPFCEVGVFFFY